MQVDISDQFNRRQIARHMGTPSTRPGTLVLDSDQFSAFWSQLEQAGLFELPRYRGASPPDDVDYISVHAANRRLIFRNPGTPSPDSREFEQVEGWRAAVIVVSKFFNVR